jgi:hypothetical protein
MLVRSGWPQETVTEWSRKADEGLFVSINPCHSDNDVGTELTGTHEPLWSRLMVAWGRRRAGDGLAAPPLPPRVPVTRTDDEYDPHTSHVPYPNYYVYHTQEQALKQARFRNRHKNVPPPPLPSRVVQ